MLVASSLFNLAHAGEFKSKSTGLENPSSMPSVKYERISEEVNENTNVESGLYVYKYSNNDDLIKAIKSLNNAGFNSPTVAESLDLSVIQNTIVQLSHSGNKDLNKKSLIEKAFSKMTRQGIKSTDGYTIRNTVVSVTEGGTMINQAYKISFSGVAYNGDQLFTIPDDGLALTLHNTKDGYLFVVLSTIR